MSWFKVHIIERDQKVEMTNCQVYTGNDIRPDGFMALSNVKHISMILLLC